MSITRQAFRAAYWILLIVFITLATLVLCARYVLLPRVDHWRGAIAGYVSEALGTPVHIGYIDADWRGLNLQLTLHQVAIGADPNASDLSFPVASAVFGWRSMLSMSPRFRRLTLQGLDLTLRRDADNRLWVVGQAIDLSEDSDFRRLSEHPALEWLAAQSLIDVQGSTVRWVDERRGAPMLVLNHVAFAMRSTANAQQFSLQASPPDGLGRELTILGRSKRPARVQDPHAPSNWQGLGYIAVRGARPAAWRPWINVPAGEGEADLQSWLSIENGQLGGLRADLQIRDAALPLGDAGGAIALRQAALHVDGLFGDLFPATPWPMVRSAGHGVRLRAAVSGARLERTPWFQPSDIAFDSLDMDARLQRDAQRSMSLRIAHAGLKNSDMDVVLHGVWSDRGSSAAGSMDVRGTLRDGKASAIYRYLPNDVEQDARDWLAHGLPRGRITNADFVVRGDLADFPYSNAPGEFRISGQFDQLTVDYVPFKLPGKRWPYLENLSGTIDINGLELTAQTAPGGQMQAEAGTAPVELGAFTVHIPDMDHNAVLNVKGETSGKAQSYLDAINASPLGAWLDDVLARAQASGNLRAPIEVSVPLANVDRVSVQGQAAWQGNDFSFGGPWPVVTDLRGSLVFDQDSVRTQDLSGRFLGGPLKLSGLMSGATQDIRFSGVATAAALRQLADVSTLASLTGQAAYDGSLRYGRGGVVDVKLASDLKGMKVDLPAPLAKAAEQVRPVRMQWGPAADRGVPGRRWLDIDLGAGVRLRAEHVDTRKAATYFDRAMLAVNRPMVLPASGLELDLNLALLDVIAWHRQASGTRATAAPAWLPAPSSIAIQAKILRLGGLDINDAKLALSQPSPGQWRMSMNSRQAEGTAAWREASGGVAGGVIARFSRLAIDSVGEQPAAENNDADTDILDIPAIDLQAREFSLYGRPLGSLQVSGTNLERGRRWRLDRLGIVNEAGRLESTGQWTLDGPARGLTVDTQLHINDLGKLITDLGLPNTVQGGSGTISGTLTWHNLPWERRLEDLEGVLDVSLGKGRFVHVNSRSARLLEVLSLQSLTRLARLQSNPASAMRDGFPFDTLRGHLRLADGLVHTTDYKINGPVAAVVLAGTADIVKKRWDVRGVVVPNLDASGAAIIAGLAVNPLIGLGAFVTQWLLSQPLAKAMTTEYSVTGSWDEPVLRELELSGEPSGRQ